MEIFELRYFLAVAAVENMHQAAEKVRVSPASLSKTIKKLEAELDVNLFLRVGKSIQLTDAGRALQLRSAALVALEEDTRLQIGGERWSVQARIAGPEILLANEGLRLTQTIRKRFPDATITLMDLSDEDSMAAVKKGQAHLALNTVEDEKTLSSRQLADVTFVTVCDRSHPLAKKSSVEVGKLLEHPFVSAETHLFGRVAAQASKDGWRDDKFPRKIRWEVDRVSVLLATVREQGAIAYLPTSLAKAQNFKVLKVTGCPYSCEQKISLYWRKEPELWWWNQVVGSTEGV